MIDRSLSRRGWTVLIGVPALFLTAFFLAAEPKLLGLPICSVKLFTGIDCPGCGISRSIVYLVHGRLRQSIDLNPMGIVIAVWLSVLFIKTAINFISNKKSGPVLSQRSKDIMLLAFVAALFLQWIAKLVVMY